MHPKDLYNETLVAASVAESEGFEGMAAAFREVAAELFMELDRSEQKVVVAEVKQNSNRKLTLVC